MALFDIADDEVLPKSELWPYLVKALAGFTCQGDGPHNGVLNAHHKDEDKTNNRLSNGMCLCKGCHTRLHLAGKPKSEEHKAKIRELPRDGHPQTVETKRKCKEGGVRRYERPGERERTSAALKGATKGRRRPPAAVAATAAKNRGQKRSPETRQRISAGLKASEKLKAFHASRSFP